MRQALLLAALALAACGFRTEKLFGSYLRIEVREVGRNLYCNAAGADPAATLLPDLQAVMDWQAARGITLADAESLLQAPYALIDMGARPTGGYGIAVAREAVLRGELVILQATFVSPAPGALVTQALTSPCALVQLPPGRYTSVEVNDQTGTVRASGGLAQKPAAGGPVE